MTRPPDPPQPAPSASSAPPGDHGRPARPAGASANATSPGAAPTSQGHAPATRPPAALLTLAIEASNPGPFPSTPISPETGTAGASGVPLADRASVALGRVIAGVGAELLAREPLRSEHRHEDDLLPAIDRLFKSAGASPKDIRKVAVSVGPGGFTGLRSAIAAAKMIAEATGSECCAVPTAVVAALGVPASTRAAAPLLVLLAWKREDVWAARFEPGARAEHAAAGALMPLSAVAHAGDVTIVADEALERLMREQGHLHAGRVVLPPRLDAANVLEASAWLPGVDPLALLPLYPREPEAVTKWRELGKGPGPAKPVLGV